MSTVYSLPEERSVVDHYCLYSFSSKSIDELSSQTATSERLLEVVLTNLSPSEEKHLRTFVAKAVFKTGLTAPLSGTVAPFPTEGAPISGVAMSGMGTFAPRAMMCYHCVIPDCEAADGGEDMPDRMYLLCLVQECDDEEGFELFTSDMDLFAEQLQPVLHAQRMEAVQEALSTWWQTAIRQYGAAVMAMGEALPAILFLAIRSAVVSVEGNSTAVQQALRIARSVSFIGDLRVQEEGASAVIRSLPSGAVEVTPNVSNTFCREWAQSLQLCHGGPIKLRRMMEAYKQKVVLQLNKLQRLLSDAARDIYALYRAYDELRSNNNRDIILDLVTKTGTQADDVLAVLLPKLEAFDREKQQAVVPLTSSDSTPLLSTSTGQRVRARAQVKESAVIEDDGTPDIASTPSSGHQSHSSRQSRTGRTLRGLLSVEAGDNDDLIAM